MMDSLYRIIFSGGIREGFHPDKVRVHVAARLGLDERQTIRVFSGVKVVLKKDLTEHASANFVRNLESLGMLTTAERMPASPKTQAAPAPVAPPAAVAKPVPKKPVSAFTRSDDWMNETGFANFERTHLNLARAEALLNSTVASNVAPPAPVAETPPAPAEMAEPAPAEEELPAPVIIVEQAPEPEPAPESPLSMEPAAPVMTETPFPALLPDEDDDGAPPAFPVPPANNPVLINGTFVCSHCGTLHQIEASLQVRQSS